MSFHFALLLISSFFRYIAEETKELFSAVIDGETSYFGKRDESKLKYVHHFSGKENH